MRNAYKLFLSPKQRTLVERSDHRRVDNFKMDRTEAGRENGS